ncbi:MAG: AAA family ATPase [Methylococcaceae bacterium]|nr:AAA family ATPase [Methylococcaceae bacterium]
MALKKLPIGLQTFSELITENYYYVDKTPFVEKLANEGKYYFLSRPRRFGKSLLLSTLKSAFLGEQTLFKGLYLENNWDWSKQYPVIHLSFGGGGASSVHILYQIIQFNLDSCAKQYNIQLSNNYPPNRFGELIQALYEQTGMPVVILIDEYDKPILDNLKKPDFAETIRDELKNLYAVIKDHDTYIKFALLTGVSKFSKVSLFSGLNNLRDISLNPDYASLCGYTEAEIKQVFAERLEGVDFKKLARWYNGYNFLGENVYNPFSILLYLDSKEFDNYWFETGSPSFLLKLIKSGQYAAPDLENISLTKSCLGSFDINDITLETLLFQTGYLTIKSVESFGGDKLFHLSYPNQEVKASLNQYLLSDLIRGNPSDNAKNRMAMYKALQQADFVSLKQTIVRLFASIPHDWYRKNQMSHYEGYDASIIYSCFCAFGFTVIAEDSTNKGRIDLTVMLDNKVFIIEFKALDEQAEQGTALAQIKAKNYQQKYLTTEKELFLIGMEFDKQQRNLVFFETEKVS